MGRPAHVKKTRTPILVDAAAEVMFASDNTCCVCHERGKAVQIHHLDENPDNNDFSNLALLCLECHNDTQTTGGFGRKLSAAVVAKYREDWILRVVQRRDKADELAVKGVAGGPAFAVAPGASLKGRPPSLAYINSLPVLRDELLKHLQPQWDTGVTATMMQASYDYIDALEGVLVTLAGYYAEGTFGEMTPQQFFSEQISARFRWHRTHAEPEGPGTGGTIVNIICGGNVMRDVEHMVEDMVMSVVGYDDSFDHEEWRRRWNAEAPWQ